MRFDVVIIGGGWAGCSAAEKLVEAGRKVCIVSEGLSLSAVKYDSPYARLAALQKQGAVVLRGDRAVCGKIEDGKVVEVRTRNQDEPLVADEYILATGKFFSRGLLSDKDHVWEPVFGADVDYDPDRTKWYDPDFDAPQPFIKFGVKTDAEGHVLVEGRAIVNLTAVGDIRND